MMPLHEKIEVERSARDCFRYLADFSTSEQWDPGVYRAAKVTAGAPAVGSEFELLLQSAGRRLPMRYCIEELETDRRIVLRGQGDGFSAFDTISIEPLSADSARIDYRAEITFHGPASHIEPLLSPWLNRVGRQAVAGLQRALTPQPPQPPGMLSRIGQRLILPGAWSFTERGYLAMPDKGLSEFVDGRTYVITGPTSGIGLASACQLARLGGRLLLVGRDPERLARAMAEIRDFSGCANDKVICLDAELSLLSEVDRISQEIYYHAPRIDGLINNAGALFAERDETAEGNERALAINLLSPWFLTRELLPALRQAGGRVINVASGGMYLQPLHLDDMQYQQGPYDGSKAYARAKRALVAVTEHWAQTITDVDFHSMHPGWAATPGVARSLPAFNRRLGKWLRDSRMAADTIVWLATSSAVAGDSGRFWFDRRPRPTALLPGTAVSAAERDALIEWLDSCP